MFGKFRPILTKYWPLSGLVRTLDHNLGTKTPDLRHLGPSQLARTFRLMGRSPYLSKSRFSAIFVDFAQILTFEWPLEHPEMDHVLGTKTPDFGHLG